MRSAAIPSRLAAALYGARYAYLGMIDAAARRHGVPVAIARAVLRIESGGREQAANCRLRAYAASRGKPISISLPRARNAWSSWSIREL